MNKLAQTGFTLAELLITLGLIGIIAMLTLPGLLDGMGTSNRRAIMKDTLKILTEAAEALTLQGNVPADTYQAMVSRIRTLDRNDTTKIITLHNGATLDSFNGGCGGAQNPAETILIDLNGKNGPNTDGQDRVWVIASWAVNNGTNCSSFTTETITGGMVKPVNRNTTTAAANLAFYKELTR